jgi:hypothetical protein
LGEFVVKNWSDYSKLLAILKTLEGRDDPANAPPQKHEHLHKHEHSVPAANRGMKHEEAKNIIEGVLVNRRKG